MKIAYVVLMLAVVSALAADFCNDATSGDPCESETVRECV